jgi:ribosomal protein L3
MTIGLVGRKIGMTRVFSLQKGNLYPVSVVEVHP